MVVALGLPALTGFAPRAAAGDIPPAVPRPANQPGPERGAANAAFAAALDNLKFPGVAIDLQERCVDVESSVCLRRGMLELVACTKGTKEHESIVAIEAKAMHLHAALLLLGAKQGNPAMRKPIEGEAERWIDVPPRGGPVDVFLVFTNKEGKVVEHPIRDFIASSGTSAEDPARAGKENAFPTNAFVFAGSLLWGEGPGPRRYVSDESGNVISLATFGDELLCLPGTHGQDNAALEWQVNATGLPAIGSKVTLRLRPRIPPAAKPDEVVPPPSVRIPEKARQ